MMGYFVIAGIMSVIGMVVGQRLQSKMKKYSQIPIRSGRTGAQIAQTMLDYYGIGDVRIVQGQGFLTDHYNPMEKVIVLSPAIYQGYSIAAAAVAAHECGHAVQHAQAYPWLKMRSAIVPVVNFAAMAQQYLLMFALGAYGMAQSGWLLNITIAAFAITAAFSLITLPVEFDASNRALAWLDQTGELSGQEHEGAKDGLWWAAMTYVVKALSSFVMVLYLLMRARQQR